MNCPHCNVAVHEYWREHQVSADRTNETIIVSAMGCPQCKKLIAKISLFRNTNFSLPPLTKYYIVPRFSKIVEASKEVPEKLRTDYQEACIALEFSPKASAAMSRRILQTVLIEQGYKDRDLAKQIEALLNEQDARKALPSDLHTTVDAIRNFGNFSAHPITDLTTLQVIDVQEHEAEWCLQIVSDLFDHYYVRPAVARERKVQLDTKLQAAGKPPTK